MQKQNKILGKYSVINTIRDKQKKAVLGKKRVNSQVLALKKELSLKYRKIKVSLQKLNKYQLEMKRELKSLEKKINNKSREFTKSIYGKNLKIVNLEKEIAVFRIEKQALSSSASPVDTQNTPGYVKRQNEVRRKEKELLERYLKTAKDETLRLTKEMAVKKMLADL